MNLWWRVWLGRYLMPGELLLTGTEHSGTESVGPRRYILGLGEMGGV